MPPRPVESTPRHVPDWNALLIERARTAAASAPQATRRRSGPASLAEAIHRFVDRNWD